MIDQVGYWALVAVGFGFLIFIHELGHFLAAKFVGIRVMRFAIGFGPRLFGTNRNVDHKDHDKRVPGTDYCLCLIPCGGYVKMAGGEGEGDAELTGASDEFPSKTPGQRALVIAAGPFMSVAAAVPLLFFLLLVGMERPSSRINTVMPDTPAWKVGLKRGDLITGFRNQGEDDWKEVRFWREVRFNSALKDKVGDIQVRVERDGHVMQFDVKTEKSGVLGVGWGSVAGDEGYVTNMAGHVPPDSAAVKAGITSGCTMLEIAGLKVRTWSDVEDAIRSNPNKTVSVKFKTPEGDVRTRKIEIGAKKYFGLGIIAARPNVLRQVRSGFPAEKAGLKNGDAVTAFNGVTVKEWPELKRAFTERATPGKNTLTFVREGKTSTVTVELAEGDNLGDTLGIAVGTHPIVQESTLKGAAGIPVGAKLLRVQDPESRRKPTQFKGMDSLEFLAWLGDKPKSLAVTFEHEGREQTVRVALVAGTLGKLDLSPRLERVLVLEPWRPVAALGQAFVEAGKWVGLAARGLWLLVTGRVSMDMMSGPVMILTATKYQAEAGFSKFFEFLVIITVHLGVINLVPFPILDGGHLAFLAVEKIRRKPCPERVMAGLMYGGMIALLALMLFITWNDVSKLLDVFVG